MNAHDAVVDAVLGLLRQAPAVTAGPIDEEQDLAAVGEQHAEAISVRVERSTPARQTLAGQRVRWTSDLVLECFARSDGRTPAGRASRLLHARAYERLIAAPTLGGVAFDVQPPSITIDADPAVRRHATLSAVYRVLHDTQAATLEPAA